MSDTTLQPGSGKPTPLANGISTAKDLFALLRDIALAVLAGLLLLFPATFNDRLTQAGFEEGSFAGLKWKARLVDADLGLKEARVQINNLTEQLRLATEKLRQAEAALNDPKFKADVEALESKSQSVSAAAAKAAESVSSLISSNAPLVERVQAASDGKWGVVYGGDARLDLARYEVQTVAPKLGIPNARVLLKDGSFRSVAIVDSPEEARQVLTSAKRRRPDAYVVRLSTWCPSREQKEGYEVCGAGR